MLAVALTTACEPAFRPAATARHLILVTVAGLRPDHMSAYLYERPTTHLRLEDLPPETPLLALDDLAAQGVVFARAYAPSYETLPSLAAIHTGRPPLATGVVEDGQELARKEVTLAEVFRAGGFTTTAFVTHDAELGAGWRQGFDRFQQSSDDEETIRKALRWVGQRSGSESEGRTFLWLHLDGPLFPFEPALEMEGLFTDPAYDGPADGSAEFRARAVRLDEADRNQITALYDGEVARTNYLLHYLLDFYHFHWRKNDGWDHTLFILAGCNGVELFDPAPRSREFGEEWGPAKVLREHAIHVPLFIQHRASLTGRRIFNNVVELQDVLPTLADWFALPIPDAVEGRSLRALTHEYLERSLPPRPSFAIGATGERITVRDGRWRLLWNGEGRDSRLFDLEVDPLALRDVSRSNPDVVERLVEEVLSWRARYGLASDEAGL